MEGLFNADIFSITTEEVPLLPTLSSLENVSTALDDFTATYGELSDAFACTSAVVGNLVVAVSKVSTIFDGLETKMETLHQKIDGFVGTMDEIISRERLVMEKFGNFDNPINPPKRPIPFHIESQKTGIKRRCPN